MQRKKTTVGDLARALDLTRPQANVVLRPFYSDTRLRPSHDEDALPVSIFVLGMVYAATNQNLLGLDFATAADAVACWVDGTVKVAIDLSGRVDAAPENGPALRNMPVHRLVAVDDEILFFSGSPHLSYNRDTAAVKGWKADDRDLITRAVNLTKVFVALYVTGRPWF